MAMQVPYFPSVSYGINTRNDIFHTKTTIAKYRTLVGNQGK